MNPHLEKCLSMVLDATRGAGDECRVRRDPAQWSPVEIVEHETPSPHTVFGQKGSGESGYLGAPAAIASAVNDALKPLGIKVTSLPIRVARLGDLIAKARGIS